MHLAIETRKPQEGYSSFTKTTKYLVFLKLKQPSSSFGYNSAVTIRKFSAHLCRAGWTQASAKCGRKQFQASYPVAGLAASIYRILMAIVRAVGDYE